MAEPWLSIIGLGEDGLAGLTTASREALRAAEFVFGGARHLALVGVVGQDWPDVQVKAAANLCAALMQKHGVMEITTHAHAAAPPGRKTDPAGYPLNQFHAWLQEAQGTHWGFHAKGQG